MLSRCGVGMGDGKISTNKSMQTTTTESEVSRQAREAAKQEEIANMIARITQENNVVSREVTNDDLDRVIEEGMILHRLCNLPFGPFTGAVVLSHSQIEKNDPLRFFVGQNGTIIINPKITRHTSHKELKQEGCYRFPDQPKRFAERFYRIEWEYDMISVDDEGKKVLIHGSGDQKGSNAQAAQHMIDHMDARPCSNEIL